MRYLQYSPSPRGFVSLVYLLYTSGHVHSWYYCCSTISFWQVHELLKKNNGDVQPAIDYIQSLNLQQDKDLHEALMSLVVPERRRHIAQ